MESREELRRRLRAKIKGKREGGEGEGNAAERLVLSVAEQHPELFGLAQQALKQPHAVKALLRGVAETSTAPAEDDDEEAPPPPPPGS
jgi:hypothetical protein